MSRTIAGATPPLLFPCFSIAHLKPNIMKPEKNKTKKLKDFPIKELISQYNIDIRIPGKEKNAEIIKKNILMKLATTTDYEEALNLTRVGNELNVYCLEYCLKQFDISDVIKKINSVTIAQTKIGPIELSLN